MAIEIVELHSVSPSQGAAAEQSLPLLHFDIIWLPLRPAEILHFYALECSERCFLEAIVVKLKHSLSMALKHFLPLASKIIFPLTSNGMPVSRYAAGDSIALTIAISDADFANTTANNSKAAEEFHDFVPHKLPAVCSSGNIEFDVVAIQVTLFPHQGICIGFTHHHAICDGASLVGFVRTWSSIHKSNGGDEFLAEDFLPSYDRSCVQDANKLGIFIWDQIKTSRLTVSLPVSLPSHKLRATFIVSDAQIKKLKSFAMIKNPAVGCVSTFVAVCAHFWSCLAKSAAAAGEEVEDDELEYLTSPIDCRKRLNPPLPNNYFGNCVMFLLTVCSHGRLKGNDGFVAAVEAISAAIRKTILNDRGVSNYFENRSQILSELIGKRVVPIEGSSGFDHYYGADYGWGRGIKYECIHTDFNGAVTLCKARDGGVEIGLSMSNAKMDSFAPIFKKYLHICSNL